MTDYSEFAANPSYFELLAIVERAEEWDQRRRATRGFRLSLITDSTAPMGTVDANIWVNIVRTRLGAAGFLKYRGILDSDSRQFARDAGRAVRAAKRRICSALLMQQTCHQDAVY